MTKQKPKHFQRAAGGGRKPAPRVPLPELNGSLTEFDDRLGLPAAITRLQRAEVAAARDYQAAVTTRDVGLIAAAKKTWCDLLEQLRKVEVTNPDVEKANAQSLPLVEVESEIARMVNAFRITIEALPRSLPQRLIGLDEVGVQEVLSKGINDALGQLHSEKWPTA